MPESIQRISTFLPLTYVVRLLKAAWFGEPLREHWLEVAILAGILIVCGGLAARLFRWD
jgi:ABC-2 type transport system permease protein